jgi:hypothetical protein
MRKSDVLSYNCMALAPLAVGHLPRELYASAVAAINPHTGMLTAVWFDPVNACALH